MERESLRAAAKASGDKRFLVDLPQLAAISRGVNRHMDGKDYGRRIESIRLYGYVVGWPRRKPPHGEICGFRQRDQRFSGGHRTSIGPHLYLARAQFCTLRDAKRKDAILEARIDLVGFELTAQRKRALIARRAQVGVYSLDVFRHFDADFSFHVQPVPI